jgi:maleylpyruvate isomerase
MVLQTSSAVAPDDPAQVSVLPPSVAATHASPSGPTYVLSAVPHDQLAGAAVAHRRLLRCVEALDDAVARRPSRLAGWTVGHLLTHLARNADSHTAIFELAAAGQVRPQYPGGPAQRDGDIQAGAGRPIAVIRDDLAAAVTRLERTWDGTHVDVWRTGLGRPNEPTSLADLVFLRWREVELHMVDLGLADVGGRDWDELSPAYVDAEWTWTTARLAARLPAGVTLLLAPGDRPSRAFGAGPTTVTVAEPTRDVLRWLTGRVPGNPAWPTLAPWV